MSFLKDVLVYSFCENVERLRSIECVFGEFSGTFIIIVSKIFDRPSVPFQFSHFIVSQYGNISNSWKMPPHT